MSREVHTEVEYLREAARVISQRPVLGHFASGLERCADRLAAAEEVAEAAKDYIATHGHWPHDQDCAHAVAQEAGHYEGEFMKDRHWVYDSSVKCDCKLGALSRAVLGYQDTQKGVS